MIIEAVAETSIRGEESAEPAGVAIPPIVFTDAARVARQLVELHGMSEEDLGRLFPGCRRLTRYLAIADSAERAPPEDQRSIYRMHVCHDQLAAGRTWEDAMAIADYVVAPKAPTDEKLSPAAPIP